MSDIVKFGERLSEQMFYKQATPDSLAERLGLNKYDIYHWQKGNGKFMPKVEALVTLADYFECSIEFLIGLEEENSLPEPKRERRPFSISTSVFLEMPRISAIFSCVKPYSVRMTFNFWSIWETNKTRSIISPANLILKSQKV